MLKVVEARRDDGQVDDYHGTKVCVNFSFKNCDITVPYSRDIHALSYLCLCIQFHTINSGTDFVLSLTCKH